MKKFKKVIALGLATMAAISAMSINVMAEENFSNMQYDESSGTVVEYNIFLSEYQDELNTTTPLSDEERIEYMSSHGETPGTEFTIGTKKYRVLDNFDVIYLGRTEDTEKIDILTEPITRGDYIPTTQGSLPYSGRYGMYNYLYTNYYFRVGGTPSIGVSVSADQAQTLRVEWIDGRNNEAMDSKTVSIQGGNGITKYAWVYGGEKFYIKFVNAGSGRISGDFNIFVDQTWVCILNSSINNLLRKNALSIVVSLKQLCSCVIKNILVKPQFFETIYNFFSYIIMYNITK